MWTTVASSTRFRLLPLLIVTEGCAKLVLFICTSVLPLPPPGPPHATSRVVIRLSTTKPIINFFMGTCLSFFGKNVIEYTNPRVPGLREVTSLYRGIPIDTSAFLYSSVYIVKRGIQEKIYEAMIAQRKCLSLPKNT